MKNLAPAKNPGSGNPAKHKLYIFILDWLFQSKVAEEWLAGIADGNNKNELGMPLRIICRSRLCSMGRKCADINNTTRCFELPAGSAETVKSFSFMHGCQTVKRKIPPI